MLCLSDDEILMVDGGGEGNPAGYSPSGSRGSSGNSSSWGHIANGAAKGAMTGMVGGLVAGGTACGPSLTFGGPAAYASCVTANAVRGAVMGAVTGGLGAAGGW